MNPCPDRLHDLTADAVARLLGEAPAGEHATACDPCGDFAGELERALDTALLPEAAAPADAWERFEAQLQARERRASLKVRLSCSFCRDALARGDAVYCAACLSPHHAECFGEHGRCSIFGCEETRFVRAQEAGARPRRRLTPWLLIAAGGIAAAALTTVDLRSAAPPVASPPPPARPLDETVSDPPPTPEDDLLAPRSVPPQPPARPPQPRRPEPVPARPRAPAPAEVDDRPVVIKRLGHVDRVTTWRCNTDRDPLGQLGPSLVSSAEALSDWGPRRWVYRRTHDGSRNLVFRTDGFDFHDSSSSIIRYRMAMPSSPPGVVAWGPANRRVLWLDRQARSVALMDTDRFAPEQEDGVPPSEVVYRSPDDHVPFGAEWSPSGRAFYVIEKLREEGVVHSRLVRVDLNTPQQPQELVRMAGIIDFFHPPLSRFEHGQGPSDQPYWIAFGHVSGLYLLQPEDRKVRRVAKVPAMGLWNLAWNPNGKQLLLSYRYPATTTTGERLRGTYLLRLKRIDSMSRGPVLEQLDGSADVHWVAFSPRGTYVSWATRDAVHYREPSARPESVVRLTPRWKDRRSPITSAAWRADESQLAITAGHQVFVHTPAESGEPRLIATFGSATSHETSSARWIGEHVYLSVLEDTRKRRRR